MTNNQTQAQNQTTNNEVNVNVAVASQAASYDRVLRVRMGVKAGMDRCIRR